MVLKNRIIHEIKSWEQIFIRIINKRLIIHWKHWPNKIYFSKVSNPNKWECTKN